MSKLTQDLQKVLAKNIPPSASSTERRAGVLILMYPRKGELNILFTKRSEKVAEHKGEISFPGGVYDPKDQSILKTALRETKEELGIDVKAANVLGALDEVFILLTKYTVTPFVAYLDKAPEIKPNSIEISEIIEAPVPKLLETNALKEGDKEIRGVVRKIQFYDYQGFVIWGATARILKQFLEAVSQVMAPT